MLYTTFDVLYAETITKRQIIIGSEIPYDDDETGHVDCDRHSLPAVSPENPYSPFKAPCIVFCKLMNVISLYAQRERERVKVYLI